MDRSIATTRRDFLARLPFLAAGGAMVLVTLGAWVRGGGNQAAACTRAPGCRSCAAFRACGLPQAKTVRDRGLNHVGGTRGADQSSSRQEVSGG